MQTPSSLLVLVVLLLFVWVADGKSASKLRHRTQHEHQKHSSQPRRRTSKIRHNLKFKHQPANPEEDWYADNLYPPHVFSHLRHPQRPVSGTAETKPVPVTVPERVPTLHARNVTSHRGRQLADAGCDAAMCHGYTCTQLLASTYSCDDLTGFYGCDSCYDCDSCTRPVYGDDNGGCSWPAGKPTSCGLADEADCYLDNMEAAALGMTHPARVKYIRQYAAPLSLCLVTIVYRACLLRGLLVAGLCWLFGGRCLRPI